METLNIGKAKTCTYIYNVGQEFYFKRGIAGNFRPRSIFIKYFYMLWLSAGRLTDPQYYQKVRLNDDYGYLVIEGKRDFVIPLMCAGEKRMADFITEGGAISEASQVFNWERFGSRKFNSISTSIYKSFAMDVRTETGEVRRKKIRPSWLRIQRLNNFAYHGLDTIQIYNIVGKEAQMDVMRLVCRQRSLQEQIDYSRRLLHPLLLQQVQATLPDPASPDS